MVIHEGCTQSKFPTCPTASKLFYCVKQLCIRDIVMMLQSTCSSWTSRVLTVPSLQQLRLLFQLPLTVKCGFVIKFLNAQSIALIEIHHTGLTFREFRVQIPVLTKLIGILFVVSFSHQGKCCFLFTLPRSI